MRRKMHGRGQVASFIGKNVNTTDALAATMTLLRPLSSYFTPPEMAIFLQAEQASNNPLDVIPNEQSKAYLINRLQELYEKYNAERLAARLREESARIAAMGPVEKAAITGVTPQTYSVPPTLPPVAPFLPRLSSVQSSGGRRTRRRQRR